MPGASTIAGFFAAVEQQARPAEGQSVAKWLREGDLRSSYYDAIPAFAEFVGLTQEGRTTELWDAVRDPDGGREAFGSALRDAYALVLKRYQMETVTAEDASRVAGFIRGAANASQSEAERAAATVVSAFDYADGREATPAPSPARSASPASRRKPRGKAGSKPASANDSKRRGEAGGRNATLAVNLQIVLPSDADSDRYDAILEAVAKHLGPLLS